MCPTPPERRPDRAEGIQKAAAGSQGQNGGKHPHDALLRVRESGRGALDPDQPRGGVQTPEEGEAGDENYARRRPREILRGGKGQRQV